MVRKRAVHRDGRVSRQFQHGHRQLGLLETRRMFNVDFEWVRQFNGTREGAFYDAAEAVAGDGSVYVAGLTSGYLGGSAQGDFAQGNNVDAFLRKYDADGQVVWTHQLGGNFGGDQVATAVSVHATGIYLAGWTQRPLPGQPTSPGGYDAFVQKLATDGTVLWIRQMAPVKATVLTAWRSTPQEFT